MMSERSGVKNTQDKKMEILTFQYARLTLPLPRHVTAVEVSSDADAEDKTEGRVGDDCAVAV